MAILPRYQRMRQRDWKDPFSWFDWYKKLKGGDPFFTYTGGNDPRLFRNGTFTRGSTATYVDSAGVVQTALTDVPRYMHYVNGQGPTLLLEGSRTNIVTASENFAGTGWTARDTPTRSAAASTASGVSLDLIGDDQAGVASNYTQDPSFTGDGVKALSLCVKEGTSASSLIWLRDISGATFDRCRFVLTWSGGLPVLTAGGAGTYIGYQALSGGVFRLLFASSAITAANSHRFYIYPATTNLLAVANVGTLYVGGVQVENATFPSSYIPTTTTAVTRAADSLSFGFAATPQAMTVYADYRDLDTAASSGYAVFVGNAAGTGAFDSLYNPSGGGYASQYSDGATPRTSATVGASVFAQRVEHSARLSSSGTLITDVAIDGGAVSSSAETAATALPSAWASPTLVAIGAYNTGASGRHFLALSSLKILAGVQSLQTCRSA